MFQHCIDQLVQSKYLSSIFLTFYKLLPIFRRYHTFLKTLGYWRIYRPTSQKRYYVKNKNERIECGDWNDIERLSELEFFEKNKMFNRQLGEDPGNVDLWLQFVKHQDFTHMKSTKTQIAERKMNILDKALKENAGNERLYKLYVDVIDRVYPSFEVSKILDGLLMKGIKQNLKQLIEIAIVFAAAL